MCIGIDAGSDELALMVKLFIGEYGVQGFFGMHLWPPMI
jgi:hypothetical protein